MIAFEEKLSKEEIEADNQEIERIKIEIKGMSQAAQSEKDEVLGNAVKDASWIIDRANEQAEEIAGDAILAKRDASLYEETVTAMKNIINGYGDEYLVPIQSIIDELADEYSFKEAGVELKSARERTRQMIKHNLAAECDYVEKTRKEYAIHFVLDAFNGKVDSILSSAKHNNYGKMEKALSDAMNIVNFNGKAFRNARIRSDYYEARLDELKWTVRSNELKRNELEEQRQIKQAIRDEERALKEYEKAKQEAEKEERMLHKALEKARKELEAKSGEDRKAYEEKLFELQKQLEEAEEKNQRAVSMAQQTRRGHVYVISNVGSFGKGT